MVMDHDCILTLRTKGRERIRITSDEEGNLRGELLSIDGREHELMSLGWNEHAEAMWNDPPTISEPVELILETLEHMGLGDPGSLDIHLSELD